MTWYFIEIFDISQCAQNKKHFITSKLTILKHFCHMAVKIFSLQLHVFKSNVIEFEDKHKYFKRSSAWNY